MLDRCFEFDWRYSRIDQFVKDPEDFITLKELCKKYYKYVKFAYKTYSANSG